MSDGERALTTLSIACLVVLVAGCWVVVHFHASALDDHEERLKAVTALQARIEILEDYINII